MKIKFLLPLLFGLLSMSMHAISFSYSLENLNIEIEVLSVPNETAKITGYSYVSGVNHDTITVPETVSYNSRSFKIIEIQSSAFTELNAKYIELPSTITSISGNLFYNSKINKVVLPSSVESIGNNAFSGSGISEIALPASLIKIGMQAFSSCKNLKNITIPKSVTSIGTNPFLDTPLESFEVESGNTYIVYKDGVIYSRNAIIQYLENTNPTGNVELLEGITYIPSSTFAGTNVRNIKFPSSLKTISEDTFFGSDLSKIVIPHTIQTIAANAFRNCTSVEELIIEDDASMLSVQSNSFDLFYRTVEQVRFGWEVVYNPDRLKKIYIGRQLGSQICLASDSLTDVVIGDNVTDIYKNWFWRVPIDIGFNGWVFSYCTGVKEVVIGKNVKNIENGAFDRFVELKNDSAVSSLEQYVISPENQHFQSIDGVIYSKDGAELLFCPYNKKVLRIPEQPTKLAPMVFKNCRFGRIHFPDNMVELKDSLFLGANAIDTLFIPDGVVEINPYALQGPAIKKLVLPASLKQIRVGTINVTKELYCNASTPPIFYKNSFNDEMFKNTTLYVPVGTKALYSKASVWCNFFKIVESETGGVDEISVDEHLPAEYYNLQGLKVSEPRNGEIVVVRRGSKVTKEVFNK